MSRLKRKKNIKKGGIKSPVSGEVQGLLQKAVTLQNNNQYTQALSIYSQILDIDEDNDIVLSNMGMCYYNMRQFEAALTYFQKVEPRTKNPFFTFKMIGLSYTRLERFSFAENYLSKAYKEKTDDLDVLNWLVFAMNKNGRPKEVVKLLKSVNSSVLTAEIYSDYMDAMIALDQKPQAVQLINEAIESRPDDTLLYTLLGKAYFEARDLEKSVEAYKKVYDAFPDDINAISNYALGLSYIYEFDHALKLYDLILGKTPHDYRVYVNISNTYRMMQEMDKAVEYASIAQKIAPDNVMVNYALGIHSMVNEDYKTGWVNTEYFWHINREQKYKPDVKAINWYGENLSQRRLTIYADQGVGDTILFLRYVPEILDQYPDCNITIIAEKKLKQVIRSFLSDVIYQFLDKGKVFPNDFDTHYCVAASSLPYVMGTRIDNIPGIYDDCEVSRALDYKSEKNEIVVGISWHTKSSDAGYKRSIALDQFKFLADIPKVKIIDLQYGDTAVEREACGFEIVHDDTVDPWNSLQDHVDQIAACDLVITVDNTTAHVAGSMGKPTWVMLPYDCFWRCWHLGHQSTPWYPNMRLFRQDDQRTYDTVIASIKDEVTNILGDDDWSFDTELEFEIKNSKNKTSSSDIVVLNDRFSKAQWSEYIQCCLLKEQLGCQDAVSIDARQIDDDRVPVPELKNFGDVFYLSDYHFADPNLFQRIRHAKEIIVNAGHDMNGLTDYAKRILYLAYIAKTHFQKKVTIIHASFLPEGNFDLTDAMTVAFFRKVYLCVDKVVVCDEKSQFLLTQLEIPNEMALVTHLECGEKEKDNGLILCELPDALTPDIIQGLQSVCDDMVSDGGSVSVLSGGPYFDKIQAGYYEEYLKQSLNIDLVIKCADSEKEWVSSIMQAQVVVTSSMSVVSCLHKTGVPCVYIGDDRSVDIYTVQSDRIVSISPQNSDFVPKLIVAVTKIQRT